MIQLDRNSMIMYLGVLIVLAMLIWSLAGCTPKQLTPQEKVMQRANTIQTIATTSIDGALYLVNRFQPELTIPIESDIVFATVELDAVLLNEVFSRELIGQILGRLSDRVNMRIHQFPESDVKAIGDLLKNIGKLADEYFTTLNIDEFRVYLGALSMGIKQGIEDFKAGV